MIDHGSWTSYVPEAPPAAAPERTLFWQNASGVDWYGFVRSTFLTPRIESSTVMVPVDGDNGRELVEHPVDRVIGWDDRSGSTKVVVSGGHAVCISADASNLSLPQQFELIELAEGDPMPTLGDGYGDGRFTTRAASLPDITDRQFGRGLWGERVITFDECEQFVSVGAIPAALQAIINQLPDDDTGAPTPRKDAVILVKGAKSYRFADPLVEIVRASLAASEPKWTEAYLRDRWAEWAKL